MEDPLGDRLKTRFEATTQTYLPRKTHTIIRLDGKAFHSYTRGLPRPFDETLHDDLVAATRFLCQQVTGTAFAYVQSDEVSLLVTDLAKPGTQPWYGGNVQKITSVTASILTAEFNRLRTPDGDADPYTPNNLAYFDSRVFTIPDPVDVVDYFQWRYLDAWRNAISSLASTHFSASQLHGKNTTERRELLLSAGVDFTRVDPRFKSGSLVEPVVRQGTVTYVDKRTRWPRTVEGVLRRSWESRPAPQLDTVVNREGGFLRFGAYVQGVLTSIGTPAIPVGSVADDATPGVATRPDPS